jgi:Zn-dependent protease
MAVRSRDSIWEITVAEIIGIPVRVHLSFMLLVLWLVTSDYSAGLGLGGTLLFVLGLSVSVVLHELGHAAAARFFSVRTRDIILYPFGGIAYLMEEPKGLPAVIIALAGPIVSTTIFLVGTLILGIDRVFSPADSDVVGSLILTNFALAVFNLIPAYPMDGGRVLRGALEAVKSKNSQKITANISIAICVVMAGFGAAYGLWSLVIIAGYVIWEALKDRTMVRLLSAATDLRVRDVMLPVSGLITLPHGMRVSQALVVGLRSFQEWFPVTHLTKAIGIISKDELIFASNSPEGEDDYVSGIIEFESSRYSPNQKLEEVLKNLPPAGAPPGLVEEDGNLLGILPREKMLEYLLVFGGKTAAAVDRPQKDSASEP